MEKIIRLLLLFLAFMGGTLLFAPEMNIKERIVIGLIYLSGLFIGGYLN